MGLCLLVLDVIREQGNSIWGYLKNSYLGGRNKGVRLIKAVIKAVTKQSLTSARVRRWSVISVVWIIFMILSIFRDEYRWSDFCLDPQSGLL